MQFSSCFGDNLRKPDGSVVATDTALTGQTAVGIYFSAHWCPPCRGFTPILAEKYKALKDAGKAVEIVFVSSDRDENAFESYHAEQPWLALPYNERGMKTTLSEKFKVQGIPTLVFVDGLTGELITDEGRAGVSKDNFLEAFPYKPVDLTPVFKDWALFEDQVAMADLKTKEAVAILIGNSSNPAKHVMPELVSAFKALAGKLAVIYLCNLQDSSSEDETAFQSKMPADAGWIKLSPEVNQRAFAALNAAESMEQDSPYTIVLNGDATKIFNKEASRTIYNLNEKGFPWSPEAIKVYKNLKAQEEKKLQEAAESFRADNIGMPGYKFMKDATLLATDGKEIAGTAAEYLQTQANRVVGVYFSAHWCGPCRSFTPVLIKMYNELKEQGKKFEIVFVSSDQDQAAFDGYFGEMPWLAIRYADREVKNMLSRAFGVRGIPNLVLVDGETGEINKEGRAAANYGAEYFPWTPELLTKAADEKAAKDAAAAAAEEAKNEAVVQSWKDAGTVVVRNHRMKRPLSVDYALSFGSFNTFVGDVKLSNGKFYYEVTVTSELTLTAPQIGWIGEGFTATQEYTGEGVGDDAHSWGVDGHRVQKWHNGSKPFGSEWKTGDVVGLACDLLAKTVSFSVNGSFDEPHGVAFTDISAEWVSPGLTAARGEVVVNFGDRPFKHSPPDAQYVSVHSGNST